MDKGGFFPKKLVNMFRRKPKNRLPQQMGISKLSKGQSVSINDINRDNRYVISVTYPSGTKRVFNDVTIKDYTLSKSKVKSVSFVYNKHYAEFKMRDGKSPSPRTIKNFNSIKFYYTKESNPISTSFSLNLKETTPRTATLVSKSTKSSSKKAKVVPDPALHSNSKFLNGGKKSKIN
jgi:hypothetical protein